MPVLTNPMQFLMTALSTMTNGLISDMQTLMLGLVVAAFIVMGLDYLMEILDYSIQSHSRDKYFDRAKAALDESSNYAFGSPERDRAEAQYRAFIRKSVE